ncbi:MAG: hypothetical protein AB7S41_03805 [Parvibaculaceae bacterium]
MSADDPLSWFARRIEPGLVRRIDAFWRTFAENADRIRGQIDQTESFDTASFMIETLAPISPDLMFEFGPGSDGRHSLAITTEWQDALAVFARALLVRAPTVEGFQFTDVRPPCQPEEAVPAIEARCGGHFPPMVWSVNRGDFNLVDVSYRAENSHVPDERLQWVAETAVSTVLGEQDVREWIGIIGSQQDSDWHDMAQGVGLENLRDAFLERVRAIQAGLPKKPHWQTAGEVGQKWFRATLEPEPAQDYGARYDSRTIIGSREDIVQCWLAGARFSSARFSNHLETFCYLKIDGSVDDPLPRHDSREALEIALNDVLRPNGLGAVYGGGTGLRYSYIDLALQSFPDAVGRIQDCLQKSEVTPRCWILFWDDVLTQQWIGARPDSPPPPVGAFGVH